MNRPAELSVDGEPVVHVVDDEPVVRDLFRRVAEREGLRVEVFEAAEPFLATVAPDTPGCLVLDFNLPDRSGLEVLSILAERNIRLPVVFISGCAGIQDAVRALKLGSLDFVEKPFDLDTMLAAIRAALEADAAHRRAERRRRATVARFASLTPREREVMQLVVRGLANKRIAAQLGVSPKTVEVHRAHVMQKTRAGSLAELVRMSLIAEQPDGGAPDEPGTPAHLARTGTESVPVPGR